jgi:hypothetical protein
MVTLSGVQHVPIEWSFIPSCKHRDPFNQAEYDVDFTDTQGRVWRVPAFWRGGQKWSVRFTAPQTGVYRFGVVGASARSGTLAIQAYRGSNPLYKHGPLTVSPDHRHLQHTDGKPFFWLGDTWWLGSSGRIKWPAEFKMAVRDRAQKGFSLIQFVVGLAPDMDVFDRRGANAGGYCWEKKFQRINPAYFDSVDTKIAHLAAQGLVPCILGAWGYYLLKLGPERMRQHYRYLVARYAAYPVVWCISGEQIMPWYLSKTQEADKAAQKEGWTKIARYVHQIDPFERPVTTHTLYMTNSRAQVTDESVIDIEMFQASHGGYASLQDNTRVLFAALQKRPRLPVVNGETCYEGIFGGSWEDVQRFLFWSNFLSGTAGYTYGANGIWSFETETDPFGASPHGACWNTVPWRTALAYPGGRQMGIGKKILEQYPWWECRPHPEWVEPAATVDNCRAPYCAGIPGRLRIVYFCTLISNWAVHPRLKKLEKDVVYRARCFDPRTGRRYELGRVKGNAQGEWEVPVLPVMQDMVLVLEKAT